MGISTGGNRRRVQGEINVTPLIDVLLVLLVIFLVVMPSMTQVEPLQIPRQLDGPTEVTDQVVPRIRVLADLSVLYNDGVAERDTPIPAIEIARTLRPKLEAMTAGQDKVVFVAFDDEVPWNEVIMTMDTIRSLAADVNHDEITVALEVQR